MGFDLKEIIAARLGENYQLHERHVNRTLVAAQRVIGFDKVYARAEGAYLYDMDNAAYLDFLSGYSVFNIGRNHPVVKQAIRDVLDLDLPNMVQMDCSPRRSQNAHRRISTRCSFATPAPKRWRAR